MRKIGSVVLLEEPAIVEHRVAINDDLNVRILAGAAARRPVAFLQVSIQVLADQPLRLSVGDGAPELMASSQIIEVDQSPKDYLMKTKLVNDPSSIYQLPNNLQVTLKVNEADAKGQLLGQALSFQDVVTLKK